MDEEISTRTQMERECVKASQSAFYMPPCWGFRQYVTGVSVSLRAVWWGGFSVKNQFDFQSNCQDCFSVPNIYPINYFCNSDCFTLYVVIRGKSAGKYDTCTDRTSKYHLN